MEDNKKQTRRLEEVSHFFLSSHRPSDQAKKQTGKDVQAVNSQTNLLFNNGIHQKSGMEKTVSVAQVRPNSCFVFSSPDCFFVETSFLACNLAIELARRNFSVGLIETNTRLPNAFYLFGSILPESTGKESESSLTRTLPAVSQARQASELPRLIDISIGARKNIKAVFWEKDEDSADSRTILSRLSIESEFLIINAPNDIFELTELLCFMNPFFVVPTTVQAEQLLESYLLIKQISHGMTCGEVSLLIMEEGFSQKAEGAFKIISEMAGKFLSSKIRFAGTIPKGSDFFQSILARTPVLLKGENSPISQSMRKLADFLIYESIFI